MDQQTLRTTLQNLSSNERTTLITIFRLFHDYTGYSKIRDDDLYTSIPDFNDFDHIHSVMSSLKEKRLISMSEEDEAAGMYSVTRILCISDLTEEELHVFGEIVGFMHAFEKAVDFSNIYSNVREISEKELPALLISLAGRGLITMDEQYTVSETFSGAVWVGTAATEIKGEG